MYTLERSLTCSSIANFASLCKFFKNWIAAIAVVLKLSTIFFQKFLIFCSFSHAQSIRASSVGQKTEAFQRPAVRSEAVELIQPKAAEVSFFFS